MGVLYWGPLFSETPESENPNSEPLSFRQPNAWVLESSLLDYFAFTDRAVAFKAHVSG